MKTEKPLGIKNYGSIAHLPNSRIGEGDHHVHPGQDVIATIKKRDKHDEIIVQEKLDGSNVGIARVGDRIFPLTRSGYVADTSPYEQHHLFHKWVMQRQEKWLNLLQDGERLVGEWLAQAHATRYDLKHDPFVAFDLIIGTKRLSYDQFLERVNNQVVIPYLVHRGDAISVKDVLEKLGKFGFHGAQDEIEGAVWRVERNTNKGRIVDYLCKYVKPEKKDGIYLPELSGQEALWNWYPNIALINHL